MSAFQEPERPRPEPSPVPRPPGAPMPRGPRPEPRPFPVPGEEAPSSAPRPPARPPAPGGSALAIALIFLALASYAGFRGARYVLHSLPGAVQQVGGVAAQPERVTAPADPDAAAPASESPAEPLPSIPAPPVVRSMESPKPMLSIGERFGGVADTDEDDGASPALKVDPAPDKGELVPYSLEAGVAKAAPRPNTCPTCPSAAASHPGRLDLSGMRRSVVVGSMKYTGQCKGGYAYRITNDTSRRLRLPLTNGSGELWNIDLPPHGSMTIRSRVRMPETPLILFFR